jgi:hypothetical protein
MDHSMLGMNLIDYVVYALLPFCKLTDVFGRAVHFRNSLLDDLFASPSLQIIQILCFIPLCF